MMTEKKVAVMLKKTTVKKRERILVRMRLKARKTSMKKMKWVFQVVMPLDPMVVPP